MTRWDRSSIPLLKKEDQKSSAVDVVPTFRRLWMLKSGEQIDKRHTQDGSLAPEQEAIWATIQNRG